MNFLVFTINYYLVFYNIYRVISKGHKSLFIMNHYENYNKEALKELLFEKVV